MVENLLAIPISHVTSIADILAVVQRAVEVKQSGEWIITARDWMEVEEKRFPTRWELDTVAPNNPVVVQRTGHLIIANRFATIRSRRDPPPKELAEGTSTNRWSHHG